MTLVENESQTTGVCPILPIWIIVIFRVKNWCFSLLEMSFIPLITPLVFKNKHIRD